MKPISVKAYLYSTFETEVRRFTIIRSPGECPFKTLEGHLHNLIPDFDGIKNYKIYWCDQEGDKILMSTGEEFNVAIKESMLEEVEGLLKIYICKNDLSSGSQDVIHEGILCDNCDGIIKGFRNKCINCADFDLCKDCEAKGLHQNHFMLRIPAPIKKGKIFDRKCWRLLQKTIYRLSQDGQDQAHSHHSEQEAVCLSDMEDDDCIEGLMNISLGRPPSWGHNRTFRHPHHHSNFRRRGCDARFGIFDRGNNRTCSAPKLPKHEGNKVISKPQDGGSNSGVHKSQEKSVETPLVDLANKETMETDNPSPIEVGWTILSPVKNKVEDSLMKMLAMGFNNEGDWLRQMLEAKDGNIGLVLELLMPSNVMKNMCQ